jgi:hypothetical protein
MKRAREQARELRRQGMSVRDITKLTGASKSSVSLWVRDIELTDEQKLILKEKQHHWIGQNDGARKNREKGLQLRNAYQQAGRAQAKEMHPLHLAGCMLYWAEGAKSRNSLYFVNSDPNMMLLFIRFLREEMGITDSEIVLYVHCHTIDEHEVERIGRYWLELLNLPTVCLKRVFFKQGSKTRHKVLSNGVCTIRVYKSALIQHIYGAIQEYGGFDNPGWLF